MLFDLQTAPLELTPLIASVRTDACGAVVTFLGVVRADGEGEDRVAGLRYEAYPEMALREMRAIGVEAVERFAGVRVSIVHRIGELGLGEASVAIAVAAPHRGPALHACEYAIEQLKHRVPVWKKERYRDRDGRWLENAPPRVSSDAP